MVYKGIDYKTAERKNLAAFTTAGMSMISVFPLFLL